jgi:hypothetical protein
MPARRPSSGKTPTSGQGTPKSRVTRRPSRVEAAVVEGLRTVLAAERGDMTLIALTSGPGVERAVVKAMREAKKRALANGTDGEEEAIPLPELIHSGYSAELIYDRESRFYHGHVRGIRGIASFEARDVKALIREFRFTVDQYLAWSREDGFEP